jgi:uncharacterized OB-fold protein
MPKHDFDFNNLRPEATVVRSLEPLVIEKPRSPIHIHTYGGETPFFRGLSQGKLLATKCVNKKCRPAGKEGHIFLPPRVYCPDCLEKTEWIDITDLARKTARVHTHITVEHPGAFNRVPIPCELISVEIEGVSTIIMSQLKGAKAQIGMPIQPVFETEHPTFTILDLAWVPRKE